MAKVARITISVEQDLLEQFEGYVSGQGYPSRSEAVKNLMRRALVEQQWQKGKDVAGAIAIVYDHHRGDMVKKIVHIQHDFGGLIVCTQHVHLDHHNCLEVLAVRGRADDIQKLLLKLKAARGIKHSSLMTATTGRGVG
jgi:CopG family nickel-responsive transcriptional regulator